MGLRSHENKNPISVYTCVLNLIPVVKICSKGHTHDIDKIAQIYQTFSKVVVMRD